MVAIAPPPPLIVSPTRETRLKMCKIKLDLVIDKNLEYA